MGLKEPYVGSRHESISQSVKRFDKRSLRQFTDYYVYFQKRIKVVENIVECKLEEESIDNEQLQDSGNARRASV